MEGIGYISLDFFDFGRFISLDFFRFLPNYLFGLFLFRIHRCFRNFRFYVCGYFAAIYARTDSFSINLLRFEMNHS